MANRIERPGAQQWVPEGGDVESLRAAAPACRGCELWEPATQVVFSAGNPQGRIALVGEQPGDQEDLRGLPFVGPAGRLLQQALDEAGVSREDVYVTNAVKHFRYTMRGKRRIHATPEMAHITACKPWLTAELRAVDPEVIVCLGGTAVKSLLGTQFRVLRDRGQPIHRETSLGQRTFVISVHPSSILRGSPEDRGRALAAHVADLRVVADVVASSAS